MTDGWIKIHRKIIEWQWFKDGNVFYLFLNLLLRANTTDTREGVEIIKRGEIKTTIPKLSEYTGLTVSQIRTCIDKLKSSGEIAVRISNKYRVITICNFDTYQCEENTKRQTKSQTNRRQIADKSQTKQEETEVSPCTPIQEKEEYKEERKKSSYSIEYSDTGSDKNSELNQEFSRFSEWLKSNCREISSMRDQLTFEQYHNIRIRDRHSKEELFYICTKMDNWAGLTKNCVSVYRTLLDRFKRYRDDMIRDGVIKDNNNGKTTDIKFY